MVLPRFSIESDVSLWQTKHSSFDWAQIKDGPGKRAKNATTTEILPTEYKPVILVPEAYNDKRRKPLATPFDELWSQGSICMPRMLAFFVEFYHSIEPWKHRIPKIGR
jgi:hypothetical protein